MGNLINITSKFHYSSVVAAWDADQKDAGSNLLIFYFFYSKYVNSVNTNKKIVHLSSLLHYNYITQN